MIGLGIGLAFHSAITAFVLAVFGAVMGHKVDTLHELPEEDPLLASFPEDEFRGDGAGLAASSGRGELEGFRSRSSETWSGAQGRDGFHVDSEESGDDRLDEGDEGEDDPDLDDSDENFDADNSDADDSEADDSEADDSEADDSDADDSDADDSDDSDSDSDSDSDAEVDPASADRSSAAGRSSNPGPAWRSSSSSRVPGAAEAARAPHRQAPPSPPAPSLDLTTAACGVLIELARVDGDINKDEVAVAREYFEQTLHFGPIALQKVRNELKAAMAQTREVLPLAQACRARLDARGRVTFLDALYQVALADGELRKSERDTLRLVARELGITEEAHRQLTRAYFGDGSEQYALLGVEPDVTDEELKSAFRRLAAEHHPDRFAHQGKAAVEAASDRFRRLQEAYEELRRIRSF